MPVTGTAYVSEEELLAKKTAASKLSILRHVCLMIIESLVIGSIVAFFFWLLLYIPQSDDPNDYGHPVFLNLYGFTVHTSLVFIFSMLALPNLYYHSMYKMDLDLTIKIAVRSQIPLALILILFVWILSLIKSGIYYYYYWLSFVFVVGIGFNFWAIGYHVRRQMLYKSRLPIEAVGFWRNMLFPISTAVVMVVVYGIGVSRIYFQSNMVLRFVIRIVIHPIIFESLMTIQRRMVFQYRLTHATNLSTLLLPTQFVGAFFGRLWVFSVMDVSTPVDSWSSIQNPLLMSLGIAIEEFVCRITLYNRQNIWYFIKRKKQSTNVYLYEEEARKSSHEYERDMIIKTAFMNTEQTVEFTTIYLQPLLLLIFWRSRETFDLGWQNIYVSPDTNRLVILTVIQFALEFIVNNIVTNHEEKQERRVVELWKPQRRRKSIGIFLFTFFTLTYLILFMRTSLPVVFYCSSWNVCKCHPVYLMFHNYCSTR
ncbi:hypothetical protein PROFUN_07745 [Planoprotostelium fungivorum]|uniref:Uncharacterized protein n=1 Tax=Planoprotostelium fungivorum TaxID=1890364 RepID=A0A2P6N1J2_9EUKA|nr:hypothetical protein PROFUN_07745 [Planoprotostelium fungivorum]